MIFKIFPMTGKRPEVMRVSYQEGFFFVETLKQPEGVWIIQKEHLRLKDAMNDAETWY